MEIDIINYKILIEDDRCIINDKICKLDDSDINNIIRIIRDWDYLYRDDKVIGDNQSFIKVFSEDKEYVYKFYNTFPDDFNRLVDYIGGIYDR